MNQGIQVRVRNVLRPVAVVLSVYFAMLLVRANESASSAPPEPPRDGVPLGNLEAMQRRISDAYPEGSDPFPQGPLPKITVIVASDEKLIGHSRTGSMGFAGKVEPPLHCQVRIEIEHIVGEKRSRVIAASLPTDKVFDGQFVLNLSPPEDGWPLGLICVTTSIAECPRVFKKQYFWTDLEGEFPKNLPADVDQFANHVRMDLTFSPEPFTLREGRQIAFCGRFSDPDGTLAAQGTALILKVESIRSNDRKVTMGSNVVLLLPDDRYAWFEVVSSGRQNRPLSPGRYIVSIEGPRVGTVATRELIVVPNVSE